MQIYRGKEVLESLEEILDPRHCMVLVYDALKQMQLGAKRKAYILPLESTIACWKKLLDGARVVGIPIVYARHCFAIEPVGGPYVRFVSKQYGGDLKGMPFVPYEGGDRKIWDNEILDELAPRPGELVFPKYVNNAFSGTPLLQILKAANIKTLVITGLQTESGVEMNARMAVVEGYYPVVVRDCINSKHQDLHDASLKFMGALADVATHDEVLKVWNHTTEKEIARNQG